MKKLSTLAKKNLVIAALEDIKARDIQAIDVRRITAVFDWIVVACGESARQTKALARHVRDELKAAGSTIIGSEGEETGEWILVDSGDVVAHVMQPAVRQYYMLEELWSGGRFDKVVNSSAPVATRRPRAKAPAKAKAPVKAKTATRAKMKTPAKKPARRKRA